MTFPWPELTPNQRSAAQASLSRMAASVAVATGLILSSRQIDLAGLDATAGILCAQILDLSPSESAAVRPSLLELNTSVTTLIDVLHALKQS